MSSAVSVVILSTSVSTMAAVESKRRNGGYSNASSQNGLNVSYVSGKIDR